MIRLMILFLFVFTSLYSYAQTVGEILIKDIEVEYVQIVGTSKLLSSKLTIEIDFGQENNFFRTKDRTVRDEDGKKVSFNSMIDALNFMHENGYNFVTAYVVTVGNQNVYHYLLKKKEK